MSTVRNTLGKEKRLKSRKIIDGLFKGGKSFSVFPFRVIYRIEDTGDAATKAGFSAPAKKFKKAVDRNRIKRLTREAYRLNQHDLNNAITLAGKRLSVFFIYTGKELPDQSLVTLKISVILQQLIKKIHESGPSNS